MKNKKKLAIGLLITGVIIIVAGLVIMGTFEKRNNQVAYIGGVLTCLGGLCLLFGWCSMFSGRDLEKEKKQAKQQNYFKRLNEIDEKRQAFKFNKDYPETDTIKLVNAGIEFAAEGRYVCKKDFNHVSGYHFAFEISTTKLKHMPEDYDDVVTLYFSLTVSYGLCDTVEGVVELKKSEQGQSSAINSIINKIKRRRFNCLDVSADEIEEIAKNEFLPESYITFLKEVGFVDFDWIDIGRNEKTPTNLDSRETEWLTKQFAEHYADKALDDYYFIGIDNDSGYYAFSKNGDGKVYEFSDCGQTSTYASLEKFLSEIITA